jgi:hypothetical protein
MGPSLLGGFSLVLNHRRLSVIRTAGACSLAHHSRRQTEPAVSSPRANQATASRMSKSEKETANHVVVITDSSGIRRCRPHQQRPWVCNGKSFCQFMRMCASLCWSEVGSRFRKQYHPKMTGVKARTVVAVDDESSRRSSSSSGLFGYT